MSIILQIIHETIHKSYGQFVQQLLLLPLMDPRSRRMMKKGKKDTKLQSLPRKPTGTCMDQSPPTKALAPRS